MAVAILGTPASTEGTDDPANYTVSAGSNRVLVVFTHIDNAGGTMDSITYGTQSMTQIDVTAEWSGAKLYAWWLDEAGITAASSTAFSASYTSSPATDRRAHYVIAFSGAKQSLPTEFAESVNDTSDPVTASLTAVANSYGVAMASTNDTGITWTWDNSWTKDFDSTTVVVNDVSAAYKALSSGTETASANSGSGDPKGLLAVMIEPLSIPIFMHHYTKNI